MVNPEIDYSIRHAIECVKDIINHQIKDRPHLFCCIAERNTLIKGIPEEAIEQMSGRKHSAEELARKWPVLTMDVKEVIWKLSQSKHLNEGVASSGVSKGTYIRRMLTFEMVKAVFTSSAFAYFSFEPAMGIALNPEKYGLKGLTDDEFVKKIKELDLAKKLKSQAKEFYKMECHTPTHKMFAIYDIIDNKLVLSKEKDLKDENFLIWESNERITGKEVVKYDPQNKGYHNLSDNRLFEYTADIGKFYGTF
jgi:hypothetical protein